VAGALDGVRVIELAGIGPSQHGTMLLADQGADVVRVDRPGPVDRALARRTIVNRGKRSIVLDLKDPAGRDTALRLADGADVLVDPFRPGVLERLGLAPALLLERNPRLVVARMTGWGQEGPRAATAGHDVNYIAVAGALEAIGPAGEVPVVPLNLVADFGGGGMLLAFGVTTALLERERSGRGQVLDVAMVDGVASQLAWVLQERAQGLWREGRGTNWLQGAAPFYRAYACADGAFVSVGALEPKFHAGLLRALGLDPADWPQWDAERWPALCRILEARFATRPAQAWEDELGAADVCFARVRSLDDVTEDAHLAQRGTYVEADGVLQPAPAPRFGRTPGALGRPAPWPGEHDDELRAELS
jgi:alpha-methylacyl-CoA racemase